jgi:hypothetical protein
MKTYKIKVGGWYIGAHPSTFQPTQLKRYFTAGEIVYDEPKENSPNGFPTAPILDEPYIISLKRNGLFYMDNTPFPFSPMTYGLFSIPKSNLLPNIPPARRLKKESIQTASFQNASGKDGCDYSQY